MPFRLTKIYTKQGDAGFTRLGDKPISKDDLRVEAAGSIDELNAGIGLVVALLPASSANVEQVLTRVQNDLFDFGGELHLPEHAAITADKVTYLERELDNWNSTMPPLTEFVLPRGTPAAAACHVARTVCRRAERDLVRYHRQIPLTNPELLRYINRLSDLLFVCARLLARASQPEEKMWER